jgi:hypothetical protein
VIMTAIHKGSQTREIWKPKWVFKNKFPAHVLNMKWQQAQESKYEVYWLKCMLTDQLTDNTQPFQGTFKHK